MGGIFFFFLAALIKVGDVRVFGVVACFADWLVG